MPLGFRVPTATAVMRNGRYAVLVCSGPNCDTDFKQPMPVHPAVQIISRQGWRKVPRPGKKTEFLCPKCNEEAIR